MKKIIYSLRTTFIAALLLFLNVQLMAQTPEITLLYPTESGIELTKGGKYLISWTDNFQSTVDILLSADGGTNYTQLASNISSSTWRWNTGNTSQAVIGGTEYKIKVQSHNSPSIYYDESDHNFSIVDQVNGYITLYQPTGGEVWAEGTKHLISWSDNLNAPVKVELLEDGQDNYTINSSTTANHIKWTVPTNYANVGEKKFRIKISSTVPNALTPPAISCKFTITASTGTFIQVLQPNGDECWKNGTKHLISWNDDIVGGTVDIKLYRGEIVPGNIKWSIDDVSGSTYKWTPSIPVDEFGSGYKIVVSDHKTGSTIPPDESDDDFEIMVSVSTFIHVLQPKGGEKWKIGTKQMISWNDDIVNGSVDIQIFKLGASSSPITTITDVHGSTLKWTVPNWTLGDYYFIFWDHLRPNIEPVGGSGLFTITSSTGNFIQVLQPNGGEKWEKGTTHMISWNDDIIDGTVDIKIKDAADYIETNVSGSTYEWNIPSSLEVGDYKIEISDHATGSTIPSDESDATFSITASTGTFVDVLQPDGGEHWMQKTTHLISWNDDFPEKVNIYLDEYNDANGNTLNNTYEVFSNPVSGSTKDWYIDENDFPACNYCKIRIVSVLDPDLTGESEDMFSIVAYAKGSNNNGDIINRMKVADVSVYPNPANQSITISLENADEESYSVEMYNCIGSLVMKTNIIPGSSNNISTSDLPNGIYFVNVSSGDTRISKKIIVRH